MNDYFKIGQEVVYPTQGVGYISEIEERNFKGHSVSYYRIYMKSSDMTAFIPVDKAVSLGIRAVVSPEDSNKALELLTHNTELMQGDWKLRYQINHDLIKQGSIIDLATVVRTLYQRSKVKELPILERKLFESALKLLIDEISFSLKQDTDSTKLLVSKHLEPESNDDLLGEIVDTSHGSDDLFHDDYE